MSNITPLRSPQEPRDVIASGLAGGVGPQSGRPQTKPPFLADLLIDTSPERMARSLASFRASVHDSLFVSSKAYRLLSELEKADLADCVPCTAGLRETLGLVQEGRTLIEYCAGELDAVSTALQELRLDELVARLDGQDTLAAPTKEDPSA